MSEPISTIVTVVSEHPQAAAAVASIYGIAKPFLAKVLGPAAEEIGEIGRDYIKGRRAKNADRTLTDADEMLAAAGREPQPVPLATLVPLLGSASLQEELSMAQRWAALLANAADPLKRVEVQVSFIEVLRQLTSDDALILNFIYPKIAVNGTDLSNESGSSLRIKDVYAHFAWPDGKVELSLDNLLRLRLFESFTGDFIGGVPTLTPNAPIGFTMYGRQFLAACTAPTA